MPHSLVALGSNLGDRRQALRRAVDLLSADAAIRNVRSSSLHEMPPVGGPLGQGAFLNAAVALDTSLSPEQLHTLLRRIEVELGRLPAERWSARTIDLDLLLYDDRVIATRTLWVPHPRMSFRRFVLAPAAEVASEMVHPLSGWTVGQLLAHLDTALPYFALFGMPGLEHAGLVQAVALSVSGFLLGNPAGPPREPPIQFLVQAADTLAAHDWRAQGGPVISGFCIDEALAYARAGGDTADEQIAQYWAEVRRVVVKPKLLIVPEGYDRVVAVRGTPQVDVSPVNRLRHELLVLAAGEHQGPVLYAGHGDQQAQMNEISAAITAMC